MEELKQTDTRGVNQSPGYPSPKKGFKRESSQLLGKLHNPSLQTATASEGWQMTRIAPTDIKESRGTLRSYGPVHLTFLPSLTSISRKMVRSYSKKYHHYAHD